MATGWLKSLQCKSKALDDVVPHHNHRTRNPKPKHHRDHHALYHSSSCKNSAQSLKDMAEKTKQSKPKKSKPQKPPEAPPFRRPVSRKPEPVSQDPESGRTRVRGSENYLPALTELPEGHPSRNVVEIIFQTSWGEKNFSGRVEMVFKIQNLTRTVARFEEYRELVRSRVSLDRAEGGGEDHARCVADGNEVMRFYCLGPTASEGTYDGAWSIGKVAAVCTYSGSGRAHESAGGGRGRRAMLVCRVIAGRVSKRAGLDSLIDSQVGCDSYSGESGELLVLDSRALLPCFLIIYKL